MDNLRKAVAEALQETGISDAGLVDLLMKNFGDALKEGIPCEYELTPDDVLRYFNDKDDKHGKSFREWICKYWLSEFDAFSHARNMFRIEMTDFLRKSRESFPELEKLSSRLDDFIDCLEKQGYPYPQMIFKNCDLRCNLVIGTKEDENTVFGSSDAVCMAVTNDSDFNGPLTQVNGYSAVAWLIHSQDKTLADVFNKEGRFCQSLYSEIEDSVSYGAPVFLVKLDIEKIEALKNGKSFEIEEATCGLVDFWDGRRSNLDVVLEKPVVINRDLLWEFQIEGSDNSHHDNIGKICAVAENCWDAKIRITDQKPQAPSIFTQAELNNLENAINDSQKMSM